MTTQRSRVPTILAHGLLFAALAVVAALPAEAHGDHAPVQFFTLVSTTSTEASGLYDHLLPRFQEATGIAVRVVAVGTGRALALARAGDADALLVHDRRSEEAFVAEGYGLARVEVMSNDFVLVGPSVDPAGIAGREVHQALKTIAEARATFLSRGDDSGTHKAELRLWQGAGGHPADASGTWYRETGAGMGKTLNTAAAMGAYTLTDRGTWLSFKNRRDLRVLVEGDPPLLNQYAALVVNPERHSHVKSELAQRFVDWLVSAEGQRAIGEFRMEGQVLFRPNAMAGRAAYAEPVSGSE